jgi:hypothetical protein
LDVVETFIIANEPLVFQCQIRFSIPAKIGTCVVQILETGRTALEKDIAQKQAVKACINKLADIGFPIPTLSSVLIQAINENLRLDVATFCARIAQNNRDDVV